MVTIRWAARWREQVRRTGGWRLVYEVCLVALVTIVGAVTAAVADWYPWAPWLVGLSTPILMVLRLTCPLAAYLIAALVGLGTGGQGSLLLVVLSASVSYRVARWWQVAAALSVAWVCYVASILWEGPLSVELAVVLSAMFVLLAVLPAGVARLVRRRRTLLAAMHQRNVQLHSQQSEVARQAQTRERARIARDLHDSLGHRLTLISLYAGMLRTADEPRRSEAADLVRQASSAAMTELRQILGILGEGDGQSSVRPLSGLDEVAEQARASGAQVEIIREGEPRPLPALTEHAAYRVIQEGLTNALRHAQGGAIVLLLRFEPDALVAGVTNTAGQRIVRSTSGQGLLGLTERVRIANGVLYHGPTPGGGFRLAATLPYSGGEQPTSTAEQPPPPDAGTGADFATLMERDRRRSRLVLAATTLSIAGCLALCLAGAWLLMAFVVVDRDTYDSIHIGQSEEDVRALLPDADSAVTGTVGGQTVPDATCVDYPASILDQVGPDPDGGQKMYRFCFRDGVLVDKQEFQERRP
ncbi:sensor histidine kinase [Micromonospora zingiberis]|uniref:sensor histidine kinase n=1 Tax=Micromonospora zingiberis TaxID=2053011 RepID=UPI0013F3FA66|nr:histidine kinase [Micromonospora zingiberis]